MNFCEWESTKTCYEFQGRAQYSCKTTMLTNLLSQLKLTVSMTKETAIDKTISSIIQCDKSELTIPGVSM